MIDIVDTFAKDLGIPAYLLLIVLIWSLTLKGFALWKSARNNHIIWFVLILLLQTIGILEILYLFLFSKIKLPRVKENKTNKSKKIKSRR